MDWAKEYNYHQPEVIYGDTDSIFVKFSRINQEGKLLNSKEGLQYCIESGIEAGKYITKRIHEKQKIKTQDLEYEKTFYPFILISKKRYLGYKYEYDANKEPNRTSMGIVTKRRDNAPIVKYVFGNIIEMILNQTNKDPILNLKNTLKDIIDGKLPMSMYIITKTLNGYYKNPEGIAHKVLADRMAIRDPGNKPKANDRIPFVYREVGDEFIINGYKSEKKRIENGKFKNGKTKYKTITVQGEPKYKRRKILQGERVEHPDYIKNNEDENIDYRFYISNQIMNPVKQILDLKWDSESNDELFNQFIN